MFEKIIGNEKNKTILKKALELNKTSHSYLFWGTEGIGKKKIALEFAKKLLCLTQNEENCRCKACIEFDSNNNPDFMMIEPQDGKVKIDQIREMQRKVAEKPIVSDNKVYIIDDSDTMTSEAQNCLLKTLEEPPEYVTIILICSNEDNMLSTIKSRCTRIHFENLEISEVKEYIKQNYGEIEIDDSIINLSQGSIGKALKLNENKTLYDIIDIVKMSEEIYKAKEEIYSVLEYMNVLLLKLSKEDLRYINAIDIVEETKKRLKANSNYDMCIDNLLFNINYLFRK